MGRAALHTMQERSFRVGLIQNFPMTADFPGNLRQIVQGYRECLDHGADLIIAPATALCGLAPKDLIGRRAFIQQTHAALVTLSRELGSAPLLLGAYAPLIPEEADQWAAEVPDFSQEPELRIESVVPDMAIAPFLLEHDKVTELEDAGITKVLGLQLYVDIFDDELLVEDTLKPDIIIHLSTGIWFKNRSNQDEGNHQWEAKNNGCTVVSCHPVGTSEGILYGGGSGTFNPDGQTTVRLPYFKEQNRVVSLNAVACHQPPPSNAAELRQAIVRGIRDTAFINGYSSVCIPLDHDNAPLLAVLCCEAVGTENVLGVGFCLPVPHCEQLGITCVYLDAKSMLTSAPATLDTQSRESLYQRICGGLLSTYAEQHSAMLISPLDRHKLMTGQFTLYGETCGMLIPLGDLYEADLFALHCILHEQYPHLLPSPRPKVPNSIDSIIHEMANLNNSAEMLIHHASDVYRENDVRYVQRRINKTALSRIQLPQVLYVTPPSQQLSFPTAHRLND